MLRLVGREAGVFAGYLSLAVVMTWPIANLNRALIPDLHDPVFSIWRLAWFAHQLRADPVHLFDANIFHPERHALAFSDALLLPAAAGAPLNWIGVHPVHVHNLLLVASFAFAGYGAYRLGWRLTQSTWPAVIAGLIFAFVPYRFCHIGHLELLWTAFMPLSVVALMHLVEQPTTRAALQLSVCHALQTLCSVYYGVYLAIYLGLASLLTVLNSPRGLAFRRMRALAIAAAASAILLLPYGWMYRVASQTVSVRSMSEITVFSAVPSDYLRVSRDNKTYASDRDDPTEERALFPGFIATALAAIALLSGARPAWLHGALLAASVDLSLGVNGLLYPVLLDAIAPLRGFRAPARFGALVGLSLSALAAIGTAAVVRRIPRHRHWMGVVIALALLVEYAAAPIKTREWRPDPPAVYRWLASQPPQVVLELPAPAPNALWGEEAEYAARSIHHWHRLVNGYSGYAPPGYIERLKVLQSFPSEAALTLLRELRVRWIVVHQGPMGYAEFTDFMYRSLSTDSLRVVATFSEHAAQSTVLEIIP